MQLKATSINIVKIDKRQRIIIDMISLQAKSETPKKEFWLKISPQKMRFDSSSAPQVVIVDYNDIYDIFLTFFSNLLANKNFDMYPAFLSSKCYLLVLKWSKSSSFSVPKYSNEDKLW